MDLETHRYECFHADNSGSIGTNFRGSINISAKTSSTMGISDLSKSFFRIPFIFSATDFDYRNNDGGNPAGEGGLINHNEGFAQNVNGQLFNMFNFYINGKLINQLDEYKTFSTAMKLLNESAEEQKYSSSPLLLGGEFLWSKSVNLFTPTAPAANQVMNEEAANTRIANLQIIKFKSDGGAGQSYTKIDDATLASPYYGDFIIPFQCFDLVDPEAFKILPPNLEMRCQFQVNNNLISDLLVGRAAPAFALTELDIKAFEWFIPVFVAPIPRSLSMSYDYYSYKTFKKLHNQTLYQFQIQSNAQRVTIFFTPVSSAANNGAQTCIPQDTITGLSINYLGRAFPQTKYDFSKNQSDHVLAYNNYLRFSNAYKSGETPLIDSVPKFIHRPCYVFWTKPSINSIMDTPLTINITGTIPNNPTHDINVLIEYVNVLQLDYNEEGIPQNTDVGTVSV